MGFVWTFLLSSILSLLFISLEDGPIQTEIPSQRAVKLKTTNQPTSVELHFPEAVDGVVERSGADQNEGKHNNRMCLIYQDFFRSRISNGYTFKGTNSLILFLPPYSKAVNCSRKYFIS